MADFYTILKNAVVDMGATTPGMRRALYDRARAALEAQIAGLGTPLPAEMQEAQRAALENAVGRIEADFAAEAEPASPEPKLEPAPAQSPPPRPMPGRGVDEAAGGPDAGATGKTDTGENAADVVAEDKAGQPSAQPVEPPAWRAPPSPSAPLAPAPAAPATPAKSTEPEGAAEAVASAATIIAATPPGARPFGAPPQSAAPARPVPQAPSSAGAPPPASPVAPRAAMPAGGAPGRPPGAPGPSVSSGPRAGMPPRPPAASTTRPQDRPQRGRGRLMAGLVLALALALALGLAAWQWETGRSLLVAMSDQVLTLVGLGQDMPSSESPPSAASVEPEREPVAAAQQSVEPGVPAPTPAGPSDQAQTAAPTAEPPSVDAAPAVPTQPVAEGDAGLAKDQERVVASGPPSEQAFLIVEQKREDGQASELRFTGSAQWSLRGSGANATLNVIVTVPERSASLSVEMKPNTDSALPASHTMTFVYQGSGGPDGNITNIPGLLMRVDGNESSLPLRGAGAMVVPGQFLMGLSGAPADRAHNMSLLRTGKLIVVPILYESKTRALFVVEKGGTGQAVLEAAFEAWGEPAPAAPAAPAQGQ